MGDAGKYGRHQGIRLLEALLAQGKRIFTTEDAHRAAAELAIPLATSQWLLHELVRGGWIRRARRGLYFADESKRGGPAPHPFAVATKLVEPSPTSG